MREFFMDDAETIEKWKYAAGVVGITIAWGIVLAIHFGLI